MSAWPCVVRRSRAAHRRLPAPGQIVAAESGQVLRAELLGTARGARLEIEVPRRQRASTLAARPAGRRSASVGEQDLGRLQALQFGGELGGRGLEHAEVARGEVDPGQPQVGLRWCSASSRLSRFSSSSAESVSVPGVTMRITLRSTGPFGGGGVADLFADGDRFAQLHQPREVLLGGVIRHARHLDRLAVGGAALRQRDVEQLGRALGVVVEQLVEIAHAVEQQHVRMLRLDAQVLLHHGCVLRISDQSGILVDAQIIGLTHCWDDRKRSLPTVPLGKTGQVVASTCRHFPYRF